LIVSSHNKSIPFNEKYFKQILDSSSYLENISTLKDMLIDDGFIYLKNFFKKEEILDLREYYFELFPENTILKNGTSNREGISSGKKFNVVYGSEDHPAYKFVRSEKLKKFIKSKKLSILISQLAECKTKRLKRIVIRHLYKGSRSSAKAHRDSQWSTGNVLSSWIVLGDCPVDSGGIVYLEKSNKLKLEKIKPHFPKYSGTKWITDDLKDLSDKLKKRWCYTNFQAGDLIIHDPDVIHASLDSNNDYMRLSIEVRFIPAIDTPDSKWTGDWKGGDGY
jgi:hypothetical protein